MKLLNEFGINLIMRFAKELNNKILSNNLLNSIGDLAS